MCKPLEETRFQSLGQRIQGKVRDNYVVGKQRYLITTDRVSAFDKEYIRRYLIDQGFEGDGDVPEIPKTVQDEALKRYIQAAETITGETFLADLEDPLPRIRRNLGISD